METKSYSEAKSEIQFQNLELKLSESKTENETKTEPESATERESEFGTEFEIEP